MERGISAPSRPFVDCEQGPPAVPCWCSFAERGSPARPPPVVSGASLGSHPQATAQATPVPPNGRFPSHPLPTLPATPTTDSLADRVRALAEEAAADTDLYVVGVDVRGFQGSRVVEVFVDSEAGAGSDDLTALSRSLGFALDTEDVVKGRYRLDVSTPGADQPLTDPRQYRRHIGRPLAVTFERELDQVVTVQGALVSVEDGAFVLEGETAPIPFDTVRDAHVVLPW